MNWSDESRNLVRSLLISVLLLTVSVLAAPAQQQKQQAKPAPAAKPAATGNTFQDAFAAAIQTVETSGAQASASFDRFLNGEGEELHTTILATERAQLTFDLVYASAQKVVSAYQEIMRMQM